MGTICSMHDMVEIMLRLKFSSMVCRESQKAFLLRDEIKKHPKQFSPIVPLWALPNSLGPGATWHSYQACTDRPI